MNVRVVASQVLADVVGKGRSLSAVLPLALQNYSGKSEKALLQEFCYGVLRQYFTLKAVSGLLLAKPFKGRDIDIDCLLLIGLYQLMYMRIPEYAAVTETVNASRILKKKWASGLLNAVLRNFQRKKQSLTEKAAASDVALYAHPDWLLQQIRSDWPEQWQNILLSNNQRAPMSLRVNALCQERDAYCRLLAEHGVNFTHAAYSRVGVILEKPVDIDQLPGFFDGKASVQDVAAQLAAPLLAASAGMRVLDACAAPGGKTAHILELTTKLKNVTAVDIDNERLTKVEENLQRLSLGKFITAGTLPGKQEPDIKLLQGDATTPDSWWDKKSFDRILLDAPCSATGVIRRHPDIKLLRRQGDIIELAKRQALILDVLWPLLDTGGMLLYATCSIMKLENVQQMQNFLQRHPDARERIIQAEWGEPCAVGRQILPGEDDMDGFYYACVEKLK